MDDQHPHEIAFGLPRGAIPALVGAAMLLVLIGFTTDTAGRIAGGVVAAILLLGAGWASRGPTLTADRTGVSIRGAFGRRRFGWQEVAAIHVNEGRRTRAVEFETADQLVIVPVSLLGRASVTEVADAVTGLWREFRPGSVEHPG